MTSSHWILMLCLHLSMFKIFGLSYSTNLNIVTVTERNRTVNYMLYYHHQDPHLYHQNHLISPLTFRWKNNKNKKQYIYIKFVPYLIWVLQSRWVLQKLKKPWDISNRLLLLCFYSDFLSFLVACLYELPLHRKRSLIFLKFKLNAFKNELAK